jgi:DNA-binding XRE family transcriptional regulator
MRSVYVIGCPDGPVKVGIARNVRRRLIELQTGSASHLQILHEVEMEEDEAVAAEAVAHARLADRATRGEWFAITSGEAIAALSASIGLLSEPRLMVTARQTKAARMLLSFGQEELAKRARVAKRTLMDFESGARQPTTSTRIAIAHALLQSGVELLDGEGVALRAA